MWLMTHTPLTARRRYVLSIEADADKRQRCQSLLVRCSAAAATCLLSTRGDEAGALEALTTLGLVGWNDGKRPSRFCSLDPECARAVLTGPGPLLDAVISLCKEESTAVSAAMLVKQLFVALNRPSFMLKAVEDTFNYVLNDLLDPHRCSSGHLTVFVRIIDGLVRYLPRDDDLDKR